jgi:hypothetical protein
LSAMCGLSVAVWRELLAAIERITLQERVDDMDKKGAEHCYLLHTFPSIAFLSISSTRSCNVILSIAANPITNLFFY